MFRVSEIKFNLGAELTKSQHKRTVSQEERSIFWQVHSIGHSEQYMSNGFRDRAILLYSSLDLAPNIILPSRMWISVKHQLSVVTIDRDLIGVLWKMPHIFTNAEYADMLSSHELQSALILTMEFSKMYYTR
jgi:hypothetical protein